MSVVVGVVDEAGRVVMGADAALTIPGRLQTKVQGIKMAKMGKLIIGGVGWLKPWQVVKWNLKVPVHPDEIDTEEYLYRLFLPALDSCLRDYRNFDTEEEETMNGCGFIVGYRGELFTIDSSLAVIPQPDGYTAVGSGEGYALGSLATSEGAPARERVKMALTAAAKYDPAVAAPFNYLTA